MAGALLFNIAGERMSMFLSSLCKSKAQAAQPPVQFFQFYFYNKLWRLQIKIQKQSFMVHECMDSNQTIRGQLPITRGVQRELTCENH